MTIEHYKRPYRGYRAAVLAAMLLGALTIVSGCQPSDDSDDGQQRTGSGNAAEAASEPAADQQTNNASSHPELVSPLAARAVVKNYYQDIDKGDFKAAYALWWGGRNSDENASKKTFDQFQSSFKDTGSTQVTISTPGEMHGAAGSTYIEIPVSVKTTLTSGQTQQYDGSYTLRRSNDADGATWAEKQWHIYSADLQKTGQ